MSASREAVASGAETDAVARIEQSLIDLVRRATDPRGNATLKAKSGIDLERAESALLGRVGELGPARLSDVAAAAGVDISTASRPVARLVERGYVERSTDPADGRACLLQCTPVGLEVLARQRAARREWLVEIMETFSPKERERFAELFHRFVTAVLATA
jgi:DNA-binding MarR family transcriptional regulator